MCISDQLPADLCLTVPNNLTMKCALHDSCLVRCYSLWSLDFHEEGRRGSNMERQVGTQYAPVQGAGWLNYRKTAAGAVNIGVWL